MCQLRVAWATRMATRAKSWPGAREVSEMARKSTKFGHFARGDT